MHFVVIEIPNGKAMAQIAEHLGYSTESVEQFRHLHPDHFPTYIQGKSKAENFWGSNLAWVPEYKYRHIKYEDYIKEHKLKPKQYTKNEIQKWVNEKMSELKESFTQCFPEESFNHFVEI